MREFIPTYYLHFKPKKKGKIVKIKNQKGIVTKVLTLRKNKPKNCSVPKQICIKCLKVRIYKQDKNYEKKICKGCDIVFTQD